MKLAIYSGETGACTKLFTLPDTYDYAKLLSDDDVVYSVDAIEGDPAHYVYAKQSNTLTFVGEPPTDTAYYDVQKGSWVDTKTVADTWRDVRAMRAQLLRGSDWTQLPDVPLPTKEQWAVYRQALRDVPNQPDPYNIVWPTPPSA